MKLRPYQIQGKNDIYSAWEETFIIFFVLATGGGKTVTFVEIIRDFIFKGEHTMLIAHREELIFQAQKTLYRNKIMAGVIKAKEPLQLHLKCQVASIQTLSRRDLTKYPAPGLIVIDEGHHVTEDNTYGKVLNHWPFARVLIVSATPYRLNGEGFEQIVAGHKTKLVVNRTLKMLQDEGWLVRLRYFITFIPDLSEINLSKGDYNEEESRKVLKLAPFVSSYNEHASGRSFICFAINVQHSKDICSAFWNAGIPCSHLDADTPDDERKMILDQFRAGFITGIINVGILTEGADFPNLGCVILGRPTKSLSLYWQMVGRGTRAEEGLLDGLETAEERIIAILLSSKPDCIVLDNAGLWLDNPMPDTHIDWEPHFKGRKYAKKLTKTEIEEEILIEVYEYEDEQGVRRKTINAKEVEGMKLIEVNTETRKKIINIQSLKIFEKNYSMFKNIATMKKPGYNAIKSYIGHCSKNSFLMVPEVWAYLERKLILEPQQQIDSIYEKAKRFPGSMSPELMEKSIKKIENQMVSSNFLKSEQRKYAIANADAISKHMANNIVNNN